MTNTPNSTGLESALSNAAHMVGIAADRLEVMFSRTEPLDARQPDLWFFGAEEIDRTLFAAYQAQKMVEEVLASYQAAMSVTG